MSEDSALRALRQERDRLTIILDEAYEQRDYYRGVLRKLSQDLPDGEFKQMAADAVGYSFPNQTFRSTTL